MTGTVATVLAMDEPLDPVTRTKLHRALFEISHSGIMRTGEHFMLGGFFLTGAMIDMLAGLRYVLTDREQGKRYAAFISEYFPSAYREQQLGRALWRSLRCETLHNFSSSEIMLANNQPHLHLTELAGRTVLHWPETFDDYSTALYAYWAELEDSAELQANAARRCEKYPPLTLLQFDGGVSFPISFPLTFGVGASAYGS